MCVWLYWKSRPHIMVMMCKPWLDTLTLESLAMDGIV